VRCGSVRFRGVVGWSGLPRSAKQLRERFKARVNNNSIKRLMVWSILSPSDRSRQRIHSLVWSVFCCRLKRYRVLSNGLKDPWETILVFRFTRSANPTKYFLHNHSHSHVHIKNDFYRKGLGLRQNHELILSWKGVQKKQKKLKLSAKSSNFPLIGSRLPSQLKSLYLR